MGQALQPAISVVSRNDGSGSDLARRQATTFDLGVCLRSTNSEKLAELINPESPSPSRNSLRIRIRNAVFFPFRFKNFSYRHQCHPYELGGIDIG
jgi:hypothetical protein